ncbi:hypothetical protein [Amycolatopsis pretoriensis]|uniref:hypothetical protein n=1 Tax=Amycolatopsis pretoriensis TaxID=218821 RepID=UPI000A383E6E|nr:hypothetical protein [Amycolatopsis pretoriensis]
MSKFSNFPQIAGFYSQLAGVLAGFAFAGLITLIASQLVSGSVADITLRSYRPLIGAFLGLVATSLNYAIVAGEDRDTPRLAELEVTAGLGFCVAALMVLYSILVLLRGVQTDLSGNGQMSGDTADLLRGTLIFGVCPLLVVMMYGTVRDHNIAKYGSADFRGLDIAVAIILLLTFCYMPVMKQNFRKPTSTRGQVDTIAKAGVILALLSLLASTLTISFSTPDETVSDYVPLLCVLILALYNFAVMYSASRYRP